MIYNKLLLKLKIHLKVKGHLAITKFFTFQKCHPGEPPLCFSLLHHLLVSPTSVMISVQFTYWLCKQH